MKGHFFFGIGLFGFLIFGAALDCPNWVMALVCCIAFFLVASAGVREIWEEEKRNQTEDKPGRDFSENRECTFREWATNSEIRW